MRYAWMSRAGRWLAILLLTLVSALLLAAPVRADGDTVALSITNGTTFTYGGTQPMFTAVVTFGTKPTANYFWSVSVKLEDGENFSSVSVTSISQDGMTLTFARITPSSPIAPGQHTATASFYDQGTGTTVYSNPIAITVGKATIDLACTISGLYADVHFLGIGQTLPIHMAPYSGSGALPAEWQSGTYTVTLDGPAHVSKTNLTSDSNAVVTITAPSQAGLYTLTCAFNGTSNYAPVSFTDPHPYTVSEKQTLGSVQIFTTPTKLVPQQTYDFYIVFHPAPGLPAPTGEYQIWFGNSWYTHAIPLTSSGDSLIRIISPTNLTGVSQIVIQYWGDIYYDISAIDFPLTNPPVPGGSSTGSPGTVSTSNNPQGTATVQGTPDATATTDSGVATPTVAVAGNVAPTTSAQSGDNGGLILAAILALLGLVIVGGAVGAGTYLMRRARVASGAGSQAPRDFYVPPSYMPPSNGTWPPLPGDNR